MRIFNETKTRELTEVECDKTKGQLVEDEIVVGHRASQIENVQNPDGSVTTTKYNSLDITEKVLVYKPFTEKELCSREINDLEIWFDTEYREKFEKCTRKIALGLNLSTGENPQMKLRELYALAETNSDRIRTLREKMKTL